MKIALFLAVAVAALPAEARLVDYEGDIVLQKAAREARVDRVTSAVLRAEYGIGLVHARLLDLSDDDITYLVAVASGMAPPVRDVQQNEFIVASDAAVRLPEGWPNGGPLGFELDEVKYNAQPLGIDPNATFNWRLSGVILAMGAIFTFSFCAIAWARHRGREDA